MTSVRGRGARTRARARDPVSVAIDACAEQLDRVLALIRQSPIGRYNGRLETKVRRARLHVAGAQVELDETTARRGVPGRR